MASLHTKNVSQETSGTFKFKDNYITLIFPCNTKINTTFEKISTNHKEYILQISQLGCYINTNQSKLNSGDDIGRSQY